MGPCLEQPWGSRPLLSPCRRPPALHPLAAPTPQKAQVQPRIGQHPVCSAQILRVPPGSAGLRTAGPASSNPAPPRALAASAGFSAVQAQHMSHTPSLHPSLCTFGPLASWGAPSEGPASQSPSQQLPVPTLTTGLRRPRASRCTRSALTECAQALHGRELGCLPGAVGLVSTWVRRTPEVKAKQRLPTDPQSSKLKK